MIENLKEAFDKFEDDYLRFDRVKNKLSLRPDIHAFLLLDKLAPESMDMVCAAEHDEIYLEVDMETLAMVATEGQICELVRCGIRYDTNIDSLSMFV